MDDIITIEELSMLRQTRYRQTEKTAIRSEAEALAFINGLGFAWLIHPSDADLPSVHKASPRAYLSKADGVNAASWWDLKQTLSERKECCYAKVLRRRGTFISWDCFPLFYAVYATGNHYLDDYRAGILSREEKQVLDLIASHPEISSHDLRRKFGPIGKDSTREMDKALQALQETFKITVAGGSIEGWTLHNWALVEDWVPAQYLEKVHHIDPPDAKKELVLRYVRLSVAASVGDIAWVFRWKRKDVAAMAEELVRDGRLHEIEVMGIPGIMYAVTG